MKWTSLLKDLKEKVGLSQQQESVSSSSSSTSPLSSSTFSSFAASSLSSVAGLRDNYNAAPHSTPDYHHTYLTNPRYGGSLLSFWNKDVLFFFEFCLVGVGVFEECCNGFLLFFLI